MLKCLEWRKRQVIFLHQFASQATLGRLAGQMGPSGSLSTGYEVTLIPFQKLFPHSVLSYLGSAHIKVVQTGYHWLM